MLAVVVVAVVPIPGALENKLPPGSENGEADDAGASLGLGCDPRPEKRPGPPLVGPVALVLLGPLGPEPKKLPPVVVGFANPKGDALDPVPAGFDAFAFAPPPKMLPPAPEKAPLVPGPGAPVPPPGAPPAPPPPPNAVLLVVFAPRLPNRPPPAAGVEAGFEGFWSLF